MKHSEGMDLSRRALLISLAALPFGRARADAPGLRLAPWQPGPRLRVAGETPLVHALDGRHAIVTGGTVAILRPSRGQTRALPGAPRIRHYVASCVLTSGRVLIWGGSDEGPFSGLWGPWDGWLLGPSPAEGRLSLPYQNPSMAALPSDEALLVVPRADDLEPPDVYRWAGGWQVAARPRDPHRSVRLVRLPGGEVGLVGDHFRRDGEARTVEVYNPRSGSWRISASLGDGLAIRPVAVDHRGVTLAIETGGATSRGLLIDAATGDVREVPLATDRGWLAATAIDKYFVLAGGAMSAGGGGRSREVWVFDPVSERWSPGPALPESLMAATLMALGSHLILAGGDNKDGSTAQTWLSRWTVEPG